MCMRPTCARTNTVSKGSRKPNKPRAPPTGERTSKRAIAREATIANRTHSTLVNLQAFLRRSCPLHKGQSVVLHAGNSSGAHAQVLQAGRYDPDFDVLVSLGLCPRAPSRTLAGGQILASCCV